MMKLDQCHLVRRVSTAGFTLIEIIVALVLVSFIMLGLMSAFSTLGATATRLDQRAGWADDAWQVSEFLRFSISRSESRLKQEHTDGTRSVFFRGNDQELVWLGAMPARYGVGGLYHFRLAVTPDFPLRLILQYAPYVGSDAVPDITQAETYVLVEDLSSLHITYQKQPEQKEGKIEATGQWVEAWDDMEHLPVRVRIDVSAGNHVWAPLIVTMATASTGLGSDSGGVQNMVEE